MDMAIWKAIDYSTNYIWDSLSSAKHCLLKNRNDGTSATKILE
jgi:hypothetical protein